MSRMRFTTTCAHLSRFLGNPTCLDDLASELQRAKVQQYKYIWKRYENLNACLLYFCRLVLSLPKCRRFNAPPLPKQGPLKRPCKKPKAQAKTNKPEDKSETPTPVTRHRRYTCKTTPPPELRDDILTDMAKVPVTAAGTHHPHRKIEDMIKVRSAQYCTNSGK